MASPFSIFRKHEKLLMVVLVIMAMFAFTLSDLFTNPNVNMPLFGLLIGAAVMAAVGFVQKKPFQYTIAGALVGLIAGFVGPMFVQEPPAVRTTIGDLTNEEVTKLIQKRNVANQYLQTVWSKCEEKRQLADWREQNPDAAEDEFRSRPSPLPPRYRFSFGRPANEDVVLGYLLGHEAEELGVAVSDEAVVTLIQGLIKDAGEPLTVEELDDARRRLQYDGRSVSGELLFEILRDEIKSRLALQLLMPIDRPTPERYWQMYRRFKVEQELELVSVTTDDFVDQVGEPTEEQLDTMFEEFKDNVPNEVEPGSPGFLQPTRVELGYVEIDLEKVEQNVPPVTPEDIETFYEANKDARYKNELLNDLPSGGSAGDSDDFNPLDPLFPGDGGPSLGTPSDSNPSGKDAPSETTPPVSKPSRDTPPEGKPSDDAPADEDAKPSGAAAESPDDPEPNPPAAETPDASGSAPPDSPAPGASDEKPNGPAAENPGTDQAAAGASDVLAADACLLQDDPADTQTEAVNTQPPNSDEAASDANAASDKPAPANAEQPAADDSQAGAAEGDSNAADDTTGDAAETPASDPYRPLTDELRLDIEEELLLKRTQAEMQKLARLADEKMRELSAEYYTGGDGAEQRGLTPAEIQSEMEAFAEEQGLRYVTTPALSAEDLRSEDYRQLGEATDPELEGMDNVTVINEVFSEGMRPYTQRRARDEISGNEFVYWVTRLIPAHVPSWDEPGVREQVEEAWRNQEARDLAKARAEAIVEQLKSASDADMRDWAAGKTATGGESGPDLETRWTYTQPFSWLRQSAAPQMGFGAGQPELSRIVGVDSPEKRNSDNAFMRDVFEELEEGEFGMVESLDRDTYYVVQVHNRRAVLDSPQGMAERVPLTDETVNRLREAFLREMRMLGSPFFQFTSPYPQLAREEQLALNYEWSRELEDRYGVEWTGVGFGAEAQ